MKEKKKVETTKKEVKTTSKKIASKNTAKEKNKAVTKTKASTKKVQKPQKSTTKKVAKTTTAKKAVKKTKPTTKKVKATKKDTKSDNKASKNKVTGLAKAILSKTSKSNKEEDISPKLEKKNDLQQKFIIAKKSDGKSKTTFKAGDYSVYPSHGIGKIAKIEKSEVLGQDFSCYLMFFEREKLTIKIPVNSAEKIGLRKLVSKSQMEEVFSILRSGVKKLKGMWSRRAQEYETKINSGDIVLLAEVIRDLTRDIEDSERSYSERIIYETAIYRLASEYAAIYGVEYEEAQDQVITTAKDKLNSEEKITQKDDFDDFDLDFNEEDGDDDDDDDSDEEDDDFDYDDDFDDQPKRGRG